MPTIVFQVNLDPADSLSIGPLTGDRSSGQLHPDRYQEDQDQAVTDINNRADYRSVWVSGRLGETYKFANGEQVTFTGLDAVYFRDNHSDILTTISDDTPVVS